MDYSVFDALRAGFGKIVFVIRKDFEDDFRRVVISKYAGNYGAEVYEQDDFFDLIDELNEEDKDAYKQLKNGVSIEFDSKGLKKYFKETSIGSSANASFDYDSSMVSGSIFYIGGLKSNNKWGLTALAIEFETADDAEDYYDDTIDSLESGMDQLSTYMDTDDDDGEDNGITYYIATATYSSNDIGIYEGIYRDGKYVLFVLAADVESTNGEEAMEELCDAIGIIKPTDA